MTLGSSCRLLASELTIEKGLGGTGGASGVGGSGQRGGEGGRSSPENESHQGAWGGEGGCGGHGVSGHGGSSVSVILLDSAVRVGPLFTSIGGGGGESGASLTNALCGRPNAPVGFNGLNVEWLCCAPRSQGDLIAPCNLCIP